MQTTKLKIRLYGDPCLRKKSKSVKEVGSEELFLIKAMIELMHESKGVGLAAPQVGINKQIFVADIGSGPMVFINPRILKKIGSGLMEEGCLSIPGVMVEIKRPLAIVVQYLDENNEKRQAEFVDLMSRVVQHETDHLHGKLIVDYASFSKRKELKKQLKELTDKK